MFANKDGLTVVLNYWGPRPLVDATHLVIAQRHGIELQRLCPESESIIPLKVDLDGDRFLRILLTVAGSAPMARLVFLRQADGVVFVADSRRSHLDATRADFAELVEHWRELGGPVGQLVVQADCANDGDAVTMTELTDALGQPARECLGVFPADSMNADVFAPNRAIMKQLLRVAEARFVDRPRQ